MITFATESSQGIREEGMTTLSRKLDSSPKVSVPGWLFLQIQEKAVYLQKRFYGFADLWADVIRQPSVLYSNEK